MPKILLMNAGSSSVKWKLFEITDESVVAKGLVERMLAPGSNFEIKYGDNVYQETVDNLSYEKAAEMIIEKLTALNITDLADIKCVGHRVVAGGQTFTKATKIDEDKLKEILALSDHAPLHNPMEAKYIELMQQVMPDTPQYAVFDSQFFTDMPEETAIFSLPYELTTKYGIRRYGEHGISHAYIAEKTAELLNQPLADLNLITLHLGSGSSVSAIKNGKAYNSSMGFTPLTGLTMGTRAGDVDPSIVPFLMKKLDKSAEEVLEIFNQKSGLLGLSGYSDDMRDIKANESDKRCRLALDVYLNKIVGYVGSYFAQLGRTDALIFAGGIGENNAWLRKDVCDRLACLGIELDETLNEANKEGIISTPNSKVKVMLVPTNEELAMVQQIKAQL
ncbi:acetate/propionate family kinase [Ligilactobacillus apodemi]|uniref:acetate/propionate family kinase n=1 Tax=Ligilactobacillus apodemi TaxID=307126 RepID=UPI0019C8AF2B|nr:acetate kinase [Ligilactobacillus apodemi]MBD5070049.1 acetate kinase [Lactobacillus sp.]MCR1902221.1 acetate kinase [Ligilactobacillus apodemi]